VEIVYQRVAAIDVHKKQITVAVRSPAASSTNTDTPPELPGRHFGTYRSTAGLIGEDTGTSKTPDDLLA
jgi:hypothetical protein